MSALRSPLARITLTLGLLGLLGLSIFFISNIITATWRSDRQEGALYKRSPGCFPRLDPSQVDATLPPCRSVTQTVTAKTQNTTVDHYQGHDYPKTRRFLTLRDAEGQSQTVGSIYEDMWNSIRVGDPASVTLWRGQVREVSANGSSCPIFDETKWNQATAGLWLWIIVGLLSAASLSLLWRLGRDRSDTGFFLGGW